MVCDKVDGDDAMTDNEEYGGCVKNKGVVIMPEQQQKMCDDKIVDDGRKRSERGKTSL